MLCLLTSSSANCYNQSTPRCATSCNFLEHPPGQLVLTNSSFLTHFRFAKLQHLPPYFHHHSTIAIGACIGDYRAVIMPSRTNNLGPLTTVWTAPNPSCLSTIINSGYTINGTLGALCSWQGIGYSCRTLTDDNDEIETSCFPSSGYRSNDHSPCWPPGTASGMSSWSSGFYSPGLECPSGYTSACRATAGGYSDSEWTPVFQLTEYETAWGCCPSAFTCFNLPPSGLAQSCIRRVSAAAVTGVICDADKSSSITISPPYTDILTETYRSETSVWTTTFEEIDITAPLIQIVWQPSDINARIDPSSGASVSNATTSNGLSQGTKVGIAVGAALGGLATLAAAIFILLRYRRRKTMGKKSETPEQDTHVTTKSEPATASELGSHVISQLGNEGLKFEMAADVIESQSSNVEGQGTEESGQSQAKTDKEFHELA
ncbi:hypothetical protein F5Y18DRAFT_83166 [Xylariaceae sp. FL1019]|nr:hypothetical protein F5Y18DRAFT_83166 [Xylariaceae sp. FL1019]